MSNNQIARYATLMPRLRVLVWSGAAVLFAIPIIANAVGAEGFFWTIGDFVLAVLVIGTAAAVLDLGIRKANALPYAFASAIAVGICFLTFWINAAVGIVGTEDNDANAAFYGVVLFAILAAGLAIALRRGAPDAMARAMVASAIAQVSAGFIVALLGYFAMIFTSVAALLWLLSAALYRRAGAKAVSSNHDHQAA